MLIKHESFISFSKKIKVTCKFIAIPFTLKFTIFTFSTSIDDLDLLVEPIKKRNSAISLNTVDSGKNSLHRPIKFSNAKSRDTINGSLSIDQSILERATLAFRVTANE